MGTATVNTIARAAAYGSTPSAPDVRTDKSRFYYDYALRYAARSMQKGGNGKKAPKDKQPGTKASSDSHPALVRGSKVLKHYNGQRAAINSTTLERLHRRPEHERKDRTTELRDGMVVGHGSERWTEQLDSNARDIVQDAFLLWYESRVAGRTPLDTRLATKFAVKNWRKATLRSQRIRKRCAECRYDEEPCYGCQKRINDDKVAWSKADRPTAKTSAIREAMGEVAAKPTDTTGDISPKLNGSKTRQQLRTIIEWAATGADLADIADFLAIGWNCQKLKKGEHVGNKQRVSNLVAKLRDQLEPADLVTEWRDTMFRLYGPQPAERTYGDRPTGERSAGLSKLMDVLDAYGHSAQTYEFSEIKASERWTPEVHEYGAPANRESGYGPEYTRAALEPREPQFRADDVPPISW